MKIGAIFDEQWYFADGGVHAAAIRKFARECASSFQDGTLTEHSSLNEVTLEYSGDRAAEDVLEAIRQIGLRTIGAPELFDAVCKLSLEQDAPPAAAPAAPAAPEAKAGPESAPQQEAPAQKAAPTALERIGEKVASLAFKELCREIAKRAPAVLKNKTQKQFFRETYLFAVNAGGGYDSSLEMMTDLLVETGIFPERHEVAYFAMPAPGDNDLKNKIAKLTGDMKHALEYPRVLSLDISSWVGSTDIGDFKSLLMFLFRTNEKCMVVFRTPFMAPMALERVRQDLSDLVSVRKVVYEPFTCDELRELGRRAFAQYRFELDDNAWEVFDRMIEAEKRDGFFYGVHTVEKVAGEFIRCAELEGLYTDEEVAVITGDIVEPLQPAREEQKQDALERLDGMIGMEQVSAQVREIINQIIFARTHGMASKPSMHMCFVGNPGTGKTTVARLIGQAMHDMGVLRIGKFFEQKGRDLCGQYIGQTAPKTTAICERAYGSVLFIDEAYSLAVSDSDRDYGKEAIDTLIAEMENHSDDLIVIFAGYPDDMNRLLDANPGMRSRVPYTVTFPSYDRDQLYRIFIKMSSEYFTYDEAFEAAARKFFDSVPDEMLASKSFGNARFVRNIYERVWSKAVLRCGSESMEHITLTEEDFAQAAKEFPFHTEPAKRKLGFSID